MDNMGTTMKELPVPWMGLQVSFQLVTETLFLFQTLEGIQNSLLIKSAVMLINLSTQRNN